MLMLNKLGNKIDQPYFEVLMIIWVLSSTNFCHSLNSCVDGNKRIPALARYAHNVFFLFFSSTIKKLSFILNNFNTG